MTRLQKKAKQDFYMNLFLGGFFPAMIFGGNAYHFLLGTGYFGGLTVDTAFWGYLSLGIAIPCGLISIYGVINAIRLQEVE